MRDKVDPVVPSGGCCLCGETDLARRSGLCSRRQTLGHLWVDPLLPDVALGDRIAELFDRMADTSSAARIGADVSLLAVAVGRAFGIALDKVDLTGVEEAAREDDAEHRSRRSWEGWDAAEIAKEVAEHAELARIDPKVWGDKRPGAPAEDEHAELVAVDPEVWDPPGCVAGFVCGCARCADALRAARALTLQMEEALTERDQARRERDEARDRIRALQIEIERLAWAT